MKIRVENGHAYACDGAVCEEISKEEASQMPEVQKALAAKTTVDLDLVEDLPPYDKNPGAAAQYAALEKITEIMQSGDLSSSGKAVSEEILKLSMGTIPDEVWDKMKNSMQKNRGGWGKVCE